MIYHESDHLELKEIVTTDLKKEIIAFANTSSGEILIGVDRRGVVVGLDNCDHEMEKVGNMIRDGIHPDLTQLTKIECVTIEEKSIIRILVQSGTKKPYHLTDKGLKPSGVFIRHGVSSVPVSETAIRELIKDTDGVIYDEMRCLNQDLTFGQAEYYFKSGDIVFDNQHKRNLGFIDEDGFYTNTALLFSDQCEHSIKCAVFQGNNKLLVRDRKEFKGSILKQLDEAFVYIGMHSEDHMKIVGINRVDTPDYPSEAIRESLLNALIHRDYSFSGSIIVNIFDDRMEFLSLGGLVKNLTYLDIMSGVSESRNKRIANVFYRLKYVEAFGMGIQKIVEIYKIADKKPEFILNPASFITVLPKFKKMEHGKKKETREDIVFRRIEEEGTITRKEVEALLECSSFTANRVLNSLLVERKIRSVGSARATFYTLP